VAHIDSASSVLRWARENAHLSGLSTAPVRWIAEDALKFIRREANRRKQYDILVADPPSYGRGPKREVWKMSEQLDELLAALAAIAAETLSMLIISCHTVGFDEKRLLQAVSRYFDFSQGIVETLPLDIKTLEGRRLNCGSCVRYRSRELAL
jgi:23S rRNA (cytosine1962-C5)-methyltransferase